MRMIVCILVLLLSTLSASAQDRTWTYIADPSLFLSAEDYNYAAVCVPSGWTPANSELPKLAAAWEVRIFENLRQLENETISRGPCDITALKNGGGSNAALLATTAGLSDITEALAAAAGNPVIGAQPNLEAARALAVRVESGCAGNFMQRQVIDCVCLGQLALQGFSDGTFAISDDSSAVSYAINELLKSGVPQNCINEAGIAQQVSKQVEMRIRSPMGADDIVLTKPDEFRTCATSEAIKRFRELPLLSEISRGKYIVEALLACNNF